MERITSRQNPLITRLRRLGAEKKARRAQGVFLCEGVKLVGEALRWGPPPELLVVAEGTAPPAELPRRGCGVVEVPGGAAAGGVHRGRPPGHAGRVPDAGYRPAGALPEGRLLVLDGAAGPRQRGHRLAHRRRLRGGGLFLLPGCAEPFAPKTVRATMGACFRLPVWEGTLDELTGGWPGRPSPCMPTALRDGHGGAVRAVPLGSAAVVIGSEGRGVSQPVLDACRATLKIPMRDRCESLNAAVAASVVLWEGWR